MESNPANLFEKLELFISCANLADTDVMSKSDPLVRVKLETRGRPSYIVGCTETVRDNLNPVFTKPVVVDYYFEQQQVLIFICADQDGHRDEDALGTASCPIAQILMAPAAGLRLPLVNSHRKNSTITIKYQKVQQSNADVIFKLRCSKVKDIEWFSKSDPFLRIYRPNQAFKDSPFNQIPKDGWVMIHETEYYQDNLNPQFNQFTLSGSILNQGNPNMFNKIEIWDHSHRGKHQWIGEGYFTATQIIGGLRLVETFDSSRKNSGNIHFDDFRSIRRIPISDYLRLGLTLSLTVGVDFTYSNGAASNPSSLHYMSPNGLNQYQKALVEVGVILMDYDTDKLIPAYGFGASLPGVKGINFCFPLSMNLADPFVPSYQGLLAAYNAIVPILSFAGPTNFSPIINETIAAVQKGFAENKLVYSTLLIITDGLITDFQETAAALVRASSLPISVIIVGVGNEDFSQMNVLDGDTQPLRDFHGNVCKRDLVQFVPFRDYQSNPTMLAEAVLRELPRQIDEFYQSIGIIPQ